MREVRMRLSCAENTFEFEVISITSNSKAFSTHAKSRLLILFTKVIFHWNELVQTNFLGENCSWKRSQVSAEFSFNIYRSIILTSLEILLNSNFNVFVLQGDRDKFETYYRQQRWKQARLSLQPPQNMVRKPLSCLTDQDSCTPE